MTYGTPHRAIGHFVFSFIITMLWTRWTPCYASAHLVIFTTSATDFRERFLLSGVFYLALLPGSFKTSPEPAV